MTTLNGFIRSTNATINRLEKAAERHAREAAKQEKLRLKAEQHALAEHAVDTYHEVIATLTAAHKETIDIIDWEDILQDPEPTPPTLGRLHEQAAQKRLEIWRPGFFDKLFKTVERKKQQLEKAVAAGRNHDQQVFATSIADYSQLRQQWSDMQALAKGVLSRNTEAYKAAMDRFSPFAQTQEISAPPAFTYHPEYIEINWFAHAEEVVPPYVLSLTAAGKLSKKDMAASRVHELYQAHICSYLLRAGREVLALLSVEFVLIHMLTDLVDPVTGRLEKQPILSTILYPDTLARLNFELVDPAESLKNFKHNIQFSKTTGFKPVSKLDGNVVITHANK